LKKAKTRPEYSIISVRIMILIYSLLCILTVLFSRDFFIDTLYDGKVPDRLSLIVFFTIPSVLIIVLAISFIGLLADIISSRPGSRFQARLLAYFIVIVIFSAAPVIVMTSAALNEIIRFWQSIDTSSAARAASSFVAENYTLHLERFENILKQNDFTRPDTRANLSKDIAAVQVFHNTDGNWTENSFSGDERFSLSSAPSLESGFTTRELPRDRDTIRYVQRTGSEYINYY